MEEDLIMGKLLHYILIPLAWLPLSVLYILSDLLAFILHYVVGYRRKLVRTNMEKALPHLSKSDRKKVERKFYHQLCDYIVETIKLLHISDKEMQRRVTVKGAHLIEQAADEHRPAFLMIGHYGNWEWVQEITRRITRPTLCCEVYRQAASPAFEYLMTTIRSRYHTRLITQYQAGWEILRMRREAGTFLLGLISDQRPTRRSLDSWTTFLHQDTPYLTGGERIGQRVDAKFLYLEVSRPRRGHYDMTVHDMVLPTDGSFEGVEHPYSLLYLRLLERDILRCPELWLWSHKRWKHHRQDNTPQEQNSTNKEI